MTDRPAARIADAPPASRFVGQRVHFVGIGGSGMSGLAKMLMDCGAVVSGSDPSPNAVTHELIARGARIGRDQTGGLLTPDIDLVVRTAAVKDDNPEWQRAKALGLQTTKYAALLGQVMAERHGIAVAGTHGKSTTTAMIAFALHRCGADPSFVVGGTVPQLGGGSRSGAGRAFVAEACEFDRSFHNLRPTVALVTNLEEDHLDCYKDLDQIIESFRTFAWLVPPHGMLIVNGQDPSVAKAIAGATVPVQTVGLADAAGSSACTWTAVPTGIDDGCHTGRILRNGVEVASIRLTVAGIHNLFNATLAVAACATCGILPADAARALGEFAGVDRRMTVMGSFGGATIVDDYGHHPTEIRTTLRALREKYRPQRLLCVFQPHQHSRTRFLLDDFAASFADADETIVPDIYFVRDSESERQRVSSDDLVKKVLANGHRARHLPQFGAIVSYLRRELRRGDLLVTMGAGNVWEIGRELAGPDAADTQTAV